MILLGSYDTRYTTGRELGRGGEGTVYELQGHSDLVVKVYNEPLPPEKLTKLQLMVSMRSPSIEAYAAWPVDIVQSNGLPCGFVMKKLAGYVPLHMVFSPMDRKKMFPDKGYNFLVHVARNLATAFFGLHEAGLVVGDVNEGNILINASGLVAFIDCDSFQVKGPDGYFYCEVGVPRYTPPELLKQGSFERVVRTPNTDGFSLAVLIFQLLFLGRHPFAGRNKTAGDIDEETAIRQKLFAYSLDSKKKKLSPPADSFSITNLPDDAVLLFHRAFETDERPTDTEWVVALGSLLSNMVTCSVSRLHSYPSKMTECPWCYFRKTKGIMYFLDDSYLQANAMLGDIERFVNGFKIERLEVKKWDRFPLFSIPKASTIDKKYTRYNSLRWAVSIGLAIGGLGALFTFAWATPFLFLAAWYVFRHSQWAKELKGEMARRSTEFLSLNNKLLSMVREYDNPADLDAYNKGLDTLQQLVHNFRRLPDEFERRKKAMEEELYNEQLNEFLRRFDIEGHTIPSFGPAKKRTLADHGIYNAAHIIKLPHIKVPGIGAANLQVLMSWRRQMASAFVYMPDNYHINIRLQKVNEEMARLRLQLEGAIRKEYQSLNFLKLNITNRANILTTQINSLAQRAGQAQADMEAFRKLAA